VDKRCVLTSLSTTVVSARPQQRLYNIAVIARLVANKPK
jgi:hypothetical protein